MSHRLFILAILVFGILVVGCGEKKKEKTQLNIQSNIERPPTAIDRDSLFLGVTAEDSTTVFDLTAGNFIVEYEKMGDDFFVFSINTVDQKDDYFWIYAVNDTMGTVAANKREIGPSDRVVWHYRLITR